MTDHQAIINLFSAYLKAFKQADKSAIKSAYALPCTLSTPSELKYISHIGELDVTVTEIIGQLAQSQTQGIEIRSLSYEPLDTDQYIACAHWQFSNQDKQVFADFCAFYHIEIKQSCCVFRHVISHEQDQLKTFAQSVELTEIYT